MMQTIVMVHMTPYRIGDIVINSSISFAWSEGGPLPLKKNNFPLFISYSHIVGCFMGRERQIEFLCLTFSLSVSDLAEVAFGLSSDRCMMDSGYFA